MKKKERKRYEERKENERRRLVNWYKNYKDQILRKLSCKGTKLGLALQNEGHFFSKVHSLIREEKGSGYLFVLCKFYYIYIYICYGVKY